MWAHRVNLARSVHDMAKQMYANKRYSPAAWQPLHNWLFNCKPTAAVHRLQPCLSPYTTHITHTTHTHRNGGACVSLPSTGMTPSFTVSWPVACGAWQMGLTRPGGVVQGNRAYMLRSRHPKRYGALAYKRGCFFFLACTISVPIYELSLHHLLSSHHTGSPYMTTIYEHPYMNAHI